MMGSNFRAVKPCSRYCRARRPLRVAENIGDFECVRSPVRLHSSGGGIEIGIRSQFLVHLAAEQVVDRLVERLAHDVPAGHFDTAQHPHEAQIRVLRVAARIDDAPQLLDLERIRADDVALDHVLDQACHQLRVKRHAVSLAKALNVIVRRQLQEYPVPAAVVWRRITHYVGSDVFDFHQAFSLIFHNMILPVRNLPGKRVTRWCENLGEEGIYPPPYKCSDGVLSGRATDHSVRSLAGRSRYCSRRISPSQR